jgi:hypothetical protein
VVIAAGAAATSVIQNRVRKYQKNGMVKMSGTCSITHQLPPVYTCWRTPSRPASRIIYMVSPSNVVVAMGVSGRLSAEKCIIPYQITASTSQ